MSLAQAISNQVPAAAVVGVILALLLLGSCTWLGWPCILPLLQRVVCLCPIYRWIAMRRPRH